MLVGRDDGGTGPHGAARNYQVCKRQYNPAAIQIPGKMRGFIPHCAIYFYGAYCFEEIMHALAYLLANDAAEHLAADNAAAQDFFVKQPRT